jgi:hypothetical protein
MNAPYEMRRRPFSWMAWLAIISDFRNGRRLRGRADLPRNRYSAAHNGLVAGSSPAGPSKPYHVSQGASSILTERLTTFEQSMAGQGQHQRGGTPNTSLEYAKLSSSTICLLSPFQASLVIGIILRQRTSKKLAPIFGSSRF